MQSLVGTSTMHINSWSTAAEASLTVVQISRWRYYSTSNNSQMVQY